MALNLLIDLLANTAQFDAAFDKSEKRIKAFAREANQAGMAASKISGALRAADVAGLDKLAAGSKSAQMAIGGLTGALLLLGAVPLPLVIGAAALGGLVAFATRTDEAAEATEKLRQRFEALVASKSRTELQQLSELQAGLNKQLKQTLSEIQNIERRPAWKGLSVETLKELREEAARLGREWNETTNRIAQLSNEGFGKAIASLKDFNTGLQRQIETTGKGVEATVRFELENGKLAETLKAAGTEGERLKETILANASAIDQHNAAEERRKKLAEGAKNRAEAEEAHWKAVHADVTTAAESKQRLADSINSFLNPALFAYQQRLTEITQALAKNAISEDAAAAARKKAAEDLRKANEKMADNKFAEQAARNIQNITASLLKGEQTGRSFGSAVVNSLRDIAAEIATQQLLQALFGSFKDSGGFLGQFATAVLGKRASGGPVNAGSPYLVGEKGPEIVVPGSSGTVIPNHKMGGGGTFAPNITINGAGDSVESMLPVLSRWLRAEQEVFVRRMSRGQLTSAT